MPKGVIANKPGVTNWVERYDALKPHATNWIYQAARQIKGKNPTWTDGRCIATAVEAAERMCASGDTDWPGKQQVNAGSRAQACAAIARWKSAAARARDDRKRGVNLTASSELLSIDLATKRLKCVIDLTASE